jgi:hypothetical protein
MIKIEIRSTEVTTRTIPYKGESFDVREQNGIVESNDERRKVRFRIPKNAPPYAPGFYTIGADSYVINNYGEIGLGRVLTLVPLRAAAPAPSAARAG